ncbi:hypothetical protein CLIB1423_02S06106 [[Candida] railenensis]|uniref:Uncharacterized protein n=1 Tax=[Candida] railenensis TaxID=45579 RepID=A0A9P0QLG0_9ASCO|nr:hypothetical protein CLIB1423_02S06106 [[Candida] railenensis]
MKQRLYGPIDRNAIRWNSASNNLHKCCNTTAFQISPFSTSFFRNSPNLSTNMLLNKSFLRFDKKSARESRLNTEFEQSHKTFEDQRNLIVEKFQDQSSIELLFKNNAQQPGSCVTSKDELLESLNNGDPLSYFSPVQHSIMCLASHLLNSVMVELNLRRQFIIDDPIQRVPSSFFFRENIIDQIKDTERNREILQILELVSEPSNDKNNTSRSSKSILDIIERLDQNELKRLINHSLKTSDSFNDIEFWRLNFNYYKSGQYLNYDHSDTFKNIQNLKLIDFQSPVVDNSEYVARIDKIFVNYNLQKDNNHLSRHITLMLELIEVLLGTKKYTPNFGMFSHLLSKLMEQQDAVDVTENQDELYNIQSLVYHSLPLHEHRQTILATPNSAATTSDAKLTLNSSTSSFVTASRLSYHFKHLVVEDPDILKPLIKYQVSRKDVSTFMQILNFYRLIEVSAYEKTLSKTILSSLVSKSRFVNQRAAALDPLKDVIFYDVSRPLLVDVSTIYASIEACLDLERFEYIDLLLSKLILFYVRSDNEFDKKVALSFGSESSPYSLMLAEEKVTPSQFSLEIFTKNLLQLLLRACREGKDYGRLLWIIPHLDYYIATYMKDEKSVQHIQRIKKFYRESILEGNYGNVSEFEEHEKDAAFDSNLIASIYETMKFFEVDGKVYTLNKLFDFENTIDEKVRSRGS